MLHATEGVWGLACDPWNPESVQRLLAWKGRPMDKGLIVIGAGPDTFRAELDELGAGSREQVLSSWPGAVTWLLPGGRFPAWITGGRPTVAARVPAHPQARALCEAFGGALVSTSANRSGRPPARRSLQAQAFRRDLQRRGLLIRRDPGFYLLPGQTLGYRGPSEIRAVDGASIRRAS